VIANLTSAFASLAAAGAATGEKAANMGPRVTKADFLYQMPLLILVALGLVLILAESFVKGRNRGFLMKITVAGCVAAGIAAAVLFNKFEDANPAYLMGHMLVADQFAMFFIILSCVATAFTALVSDHHQREHEWQNGEYYGLLALATAGMAMLAMAADLVTIFIGIETMSLAVYVLVASRWRSRKGAEAAIKYFLMGAFSTAFLLYGIALVYGATGATNLHAIGQRLDPSSPLLLTGVLMMVIAIAFKVAAVPFHMWAPDAYEGAPTPVSGFMASAVKAGAFAAALRIFDSLGGDILPFGTLGWAGILAVIAAATMTIGNIAALRQENIKRMLAYSSVSHAGVVLVGVVAMTLTSTDATRPAIMFYLAAYTITTLGAFAVVTWIGTRGKERVNLDEWSGLAQTHPGSALAMAVFMLSLGGIPPTVGFIGKFYIFKSAMGAYDSQLLWLVLIGVLNSAISIFYYLRVVTTMYFKPPVEEIKVSKSSAVMFVIIACAIAVMVMGILPGWFLGKAGL